MSAIVKELSVNARYDLQAPSVQIFYETASNINGTPSLSLVKDAYPNPLPTSPQQQFASLQFTVDLQGVQATTTNAKIACDPINPADPNWWLLKHPQYRPFDPTNPADADNDIASFTIDATTLQRAPNPVYDSTGHLVADNGYTNELTTGQLTDWMKTNNGFGSQRISLKVAATIVHRKGSTVQNLNLTYQCLSTNAVSGTYTNQTINQYPEPVPIGLAQFIYDAISVRQFEGGLTLQEPEVSGSLMIGQLFNLTGGALAEWSTMAAMVQEITENIDSGATSVRFGPPRNLSPGELVDLLRVNRYRRVYSGFSMRAAGSPGDPNETVDLGQNTPEKNSISGTASPNPQVIASAPDGSGATVQHFSSGADASTTWIGMPGPNTPAPTPGSIIISLAAANGQNLAIQPVPVCLNGVSGTMYFLCSNFVPDS